MRYEYICVLIYCSRELVIYQYNRYTEYTKNIHIDYMYAPSPALLCGLLRCCVVACVVFWYIWLGLGLCCSMHYAYVRTYCTTRISTSILSYLGVRTYCTLSTRTYCPHVSTVHTYWYLGPHVFDALIDGSIGGIRG